ncbi:FAD-dependent oxidoreductase [Myceligenerans halotolerans]
MTTSDHADVVVLGAGVIGLTTAIELTRRGRTVRVVAHNIPGMTSLAAGASWGPYLVEPWPHVRRWSLYTLDVLRELADVPGTGVRQVWGLEAARHPMPAPPWADLLPDFAPAQPHELPPGFQAGFRFATPLIDMPVHLDHLTKQARSLGVTFQQQSIAELSELTSGAARPASAIVNCAGNDAGRLAGDTALYPIRGQHVVVQNPGITEFFSEETGTSPDLTCFYPHGDTVVLGGTAVETASREPDPDAARSIIERCAEIEPRLATATVLEHRIGLRPTRPTIRVELDAHSDIPIVHNYGHGGAGVTCSWGCAEQAADLIAPQPA